jgi:hypothetical protein
VKQTEHYEQVKLFQWAKAQSSKYPQLTIMFAIPNGGKRNIVTATKLKAEGVKSGVPDIFLAYPSLHAHGLFIEMKSPNGKVSTNQREWIGALSASGYMCSVCYSFDEAKKVICEYLDIK